MLYSPWSFHLNRTDIVLNVIENEILFIVAILTGVPWQDESRVLSALKALSKSRLAGRDGPGIICPAACKVGVQPSGHICHPRSIDDCDRQ